MSFVNAMLRMSAVQALRGNTLAGAAVLDSSIEALATIMKTAEQPVILVRIDEGVSSTEGDGLFARSAKITLAIDILIASKVTYEKPQGEAITEIVIKPTDAGLEFSLDLLDRQVRRALSNPENAFAEAFRRLIAATGEIKWSRGIDPESGRKHAVRMIEIAIDPICDPAPGDVLPQTVDDVLTQLASLQDYRAAVEIMRAELAVGSDLMSWQKVQSTLLTTAAAPALIGVGPPDSGEAVSFEAVTPVVNGSEGAAMPEDVLPDPDLSDPHAGVSP